MRYKEWLYGNSCCEQINDCGCSGKDVCDCDNILLEISKLHTNDEILQEEIDNISSGTSITVDSELSLISTNPAQNKVITEALNDKLDVSAYTPTDLSNYYTKNEVNSAITNVENEIPSLSGYATEQWVLDKNYITGVDLSNYATLQDIPVVPTSNSAFTNDAGYITSGDAQSQINVSISGKQDKLTAGRGITISSNTVSLDLPISAGTGDNSIIEGNGTKALSSNCHAEGRSSIAGVSSSNKGYSSHAEGEATTASGNMSHSEGNHTQASGNASHAEGDYTKAYGSCSHTEGSETKAENDYEHASGRFNKSTKINSTFGDSGNTLFSVGNGTADNARHNAFEIRQNGDIYISLNGIDVKLQDLLNSLQAQINNCCPSPTPPTPTDLRYTGTTTGGTEISLSCCTESGCDELVAHDITQTSIQTGNLKTISVGDCITIIGSNAFTGETNLTDVVLPDTITTIKDVMLQGCTSMQTLTVYATTPPAFSGTGGANCGLFLGYQPEEVIPSGFKIKVPSASVSAYQAANIWSRYSSIIEAI